MRRQAGPVKKRNLSPRPRPKDSLKLKVQAQIINFAVIGDSHVGYGNSSAIFRKLLPKAVSSGNKKFVIFGGDNAQAGANHGNNADAFYKDFKDTVTSTLGSIPYKATIGNWEASTQSLFKQYLGAVAGQMNFPGTQAKVKYVWLDCALGAFTPESLNILNNLDDRHYYIIDFHWPLKVSGITVAPSHVLSGAETNKFSRRFLRKLEIKCWPYLHTTGICFIGSWPIFIRGSLQLNSSCADVQGIINASQTVTGVLQRHIDH